MPFQTQIHRDIHFQKHGSEFGAVNAVEYEQMADNFMFGARDANTHECRQPNLGARLRLSYWNRHFGAASVAPDFVKTFHVVSQAKINRYASIQQYFGWECGRINV